MERIDSGRLQRLYLARVGNHQLKSHDLVECVNCR